MVTAPMSVLLQPALMQNHPLEAIFPCGSQPWVVPLFLKSCRGSLEQRSWGDVGAGMSSGVRGSFQGPGSLGNPTGDCDSAQAGRKGSSKLGGQQSQISFPFLPQYPSTKLSFFAHVLRKKCL